MKQECIISIKIYFSYRQSHCIFIIYFFFITQFSDDNTFAFRVDYLAVFFSRLYYWRMFNLTLNNLSKNIKYLYFQYKFVFMKKEYIFMFTMRRILHYLLALLACTKPSKININKKLKWIYIILYTSHSICRLSSHCK